MHKFNGYDIELTRGDSLVFRVSLTGRDLPEGSVALFTVKAHPRDERALIQKRMDASGEMLSISLSPKDTDLTPRTYFWDVRVLIPVQTGGYELETPMEYASFTILEAVGHDFGVKDDPGMDADLPVLSVLIDRAQTLLDKLEKHGVPPEEIEAAVEEYMAENPVKATVTETEDGAKVEVTDPAGTTEAHLRSITHSWEGTTLVMESASGETRTDLRGPRGEAGENTVEFTFANLYNPEEASVGYAISRSDGYTYASANYTVTGYIPVTPGEKLGILRGAARDNFTFGASAFYDENRKKVASYTCPLNQVLFTVPEGAAYFRTTLMNSWTEVSIESLTPVGFATRYLAFGQTDSAAVPEIEAQRSLFLPDTIYCCPDRPFEIYYNAVLGRTRYGCEVRCSREPSKTYCTISVGDRKWRVNPVSSAFITSMDLYAENGQKVRSAPLCIRVVSPTAQAKTLCCIGDGLTAGRAWLAELKKLNPNFTFVGSLEGSAADSDGAQHVIRHEGRDGASAQTYMTQADDNPFWDNAKGAFSFAHYVENTLGGQAPDCVILFLGQNDVKRYVAASVRYEKQMVDDILAACPDMRILILTPQFRDPHLDAHTYPGTWQMQQMLFDTFQHYANLQIVPLGILHDSEFNYMLSDEYEPVHPRSMLTQHAVRDGMRPQDAGYYQFADAIYASLSALTW